MNDLIQTEALYEPLESVPLASYSWTAEETATPDESILYTEMGTEPTIITEFDRQPVCARNLYVYLGGEPDNIKVPGLIKIFGTNLADQPIEESITISGEEVLETYTTICFKTITRIEVTEMKGDGVMLQLLEGSCFGLPFLVGKAKVLAATVPSVDTLFHGDVLDSLLEIDADTTVETNYARILNPEFSGLGLKLIFLMA